MKVLSRTYYVSAKCNNDTMMESVNKHCALAARLKTLGLPMKDSLGSWNGKPEAFWLVSGDNTIEETVLKIALEFKQECVLVVHGDNQDAELIYPDGARKMLGTMTCVGDNYDEVNGEDYNLVDGLYYIVKGK